MDKANSLDSLRLSIFSVLNKTHNLNLLKRMMEVIEQEGEVVSDQIVGYRPDGSEITRSQLVDTVQESRTQFEKGEFLSIEDLEEESKSWT